MEKKGESASAPAAGYFAAFFLRSAFSALGSIDGHPLGHRLSSLRPTSHGASPSAGRRRAGSPRPGWPQPPYAARRSAERRASRRGGGPEDLVDVVQRLDRVRRRRVASEDGSGRAPRPGAIGQPRRKLHRWLPARQSLDPARRPAHLGRRTTSGSAPAAGRAGRPLGKCSRCSRRSRSTA